jgi:malonate decarboxylase gamma subunit
MNTNDILLRLFGPAGYSISAEGPFIYGTAVVGGGESVVIGVGGHSAIDSRLALSISHAVLNTLRDDIALTGRPRPIIFLIDTQGQELSRHEEVIGLNGYFAHIARCIELARRQRHRLLSVIHGDAVSGAFLSFGMMADRVCALPSAQVRVMDLEAIARVTKIARERLEELAASSPVFAPGANNFWSMGAIHEIWGPDDNWNSRLCSALEQCDFEDNRAELGFKRGGRRMSINIVRAVMDSA